MAITLLLGNGINRLNNNNSSWQHVLLELASRNGQRHGLEYVEQKPFPLLYEEIFLRETFANATTRELTLKRYIANLIEGIRHNEFHRRLVDSRVRHILTTNYDYNFENASVNDSRGANLDRETKYSVFRRRAVGNKFVWHIHGEARAPSTINLGYDQYCGYVQKLRTYATANRTSKTGGSPFKIGNLVFDDQADQLYSWLDVFFRDDVHIVGLSMDFTEIDLWWVLTYKARLGAGGLKVGTTHFHDWHVRDGDLNRLAKHSLLKALGVHVDARRVSRTFEAEYDRLLRDVFDC